jgi:PTH1 family peptidyl-tRNA hydrolase
MQVDYVLGQWSAEERTALPERLDTAVKAIQSFTAVGIERTMNQFNTK